MAQEQIEWTSKLFELVKGLPPELQYPIIIGALMLAIVWFWRGKGKEKEDKKAETEKPSISVQNSSEINIHTGPGDMNVGGIMHKPKE